ncbi:formimidoylglutamate deiminase [Massilia antarctica]|uniref:formimidoylglutamate deiminase n=1 Tax=Massilia antarctica TaxID=2765360 RepID=UPI0006BB5CD0|nr:formimidoylglutamate deiminase [Massilia sp. H27-R4]MCY0913429.1 formimidoylglutamate deiminase [Massilia sp. H27-R4]CUI09565.1 Formiminoglutamic iminohydrolase [Janthinobacterium sp. CG23_2]CUU33351.1 Formiminoglutamic iminohydrolase [Janthinobacterium sp. CG23_2]
MSGPRVLFARHALLAHGWEANVLIEWGAGGTLLTVAPGAVHAGEPMADLVLPGMVNLHSHAFQRALGGLTETAGEGPDSFWTWRQLMYRFARHITPEHIEAIAAQLFSECLRHGYTSVCEFHYVQRDQDGVMYARPAETAERIVAAAQLTGMGVTMLPVLYSYAGFGEKPLAPEQQRFRTDAADVLRIVDSLEPLRSGQVEVGVAPHSLRAASLGQIREVLAVLPAGRPLHIHIAEQQGEVEQCLASTGQRPVRYLMDQVALDARWCLVHATHLDDGEVAALAASGAVAGLCPTTEANLGDGLFPLAPFLAAGGRIGVGSDSHVSQSPVEELRWLEYGQRLLHQKRNVAASPTQRRVGDFLWQSALHGGAQASGRPVGVLAVGKRADLLVLDSDHPNLAGIGAEDVLSSFIFCGNDNLVRDVMVGGRWVVRDREHIAQGAIAQRYKQTIAELRRLRP